MLLNDSKQNIWEKKGETLIDIQFVVCFFLTCYVSRRLKGGERSMVRSETEQVKKGFLSLFNSKNFIFFYLNFKG